MSVSRTVRLIAAGGALALLATGCGTTDAGQSAEGSGQTRVFEADNGAVTIPADPQRVVATGYAVPALIEADAPLVGISTWKRGLPMMNDEDRATYDELTKVAGEQAAETNYEAVAAADPDLIVIGVPAPVLGDIDVDRLEDIAPVVAIGPTVPSAWRELSRRQADAAGALERFDETKAAYEEKAAALADKYGDAVDGMRFAHVGAYGEVDNGTFQREYDGSWGTNVANDLGVRYYGEPAEKGKGSRSVSEYPSLEELPEALGEADAITYSVEPDGTVPPPVRYVLDSELWQNLPAVQQGRTFPIRYTEAATYEQAMLTLEAIDESFAPLLDR